LLPKSLLGGTMKITIEIDCSAKEARDFLGLPDVQELQSKWLAEIEAKILADADKFLPENILQTWTTNAAGNIEGMSDLFSNFLKGARKG